MLALSEAIFALLRAAPDLSAAIGRPYSTAMTEVWHLGTAVTYPVLAIDVSDAIGKTPSGISLDFSEQTVRCWFVTDRTRAEATKFADALKAKLHLRHRELLRAGLLDSVWIEWQLSQVARVPTTTHIQAYLEFKIVS